MEYLSTAVFSPYFDQIRDAIDESENLSNIRGGVVHQAAYASSGSIIGGVLAGPFGAMTGGIAGAIIGFTLVGSYRTIFSALHTMAADERREFMSKVSTMTSGNIQQRLTKSVTNVTSSVTSYVSTTTGNIACGVASNVSSAAGTVVNIPVTMTGFIYRTTTSMTQKVGSVVIGSVGAIFL